MDEVQVWQVPIDPPAEVVSACRSLLAPDEVRRSEGFHTEKDRRRWIVARGALRLILGRAHGTAPASLRFELGPNGKPSLAGGPSFNLSHCADLALVAVAPSERPVGVDVEYIRSLRDLRSIEERYFSEEEKAFLEAAEAETDRSADARARAFLTLWTRREAAVKALGLDLQAALTSISLPVFPPAASAALPDLCGQGPCFLCDITLDDPHAGALCVQGPPCRILIRRINDREFYAPGYR